MEKEIRIYATADAAIASSEAISAKFVGRPVSTMEWISIHFSELEFAAACAAAGKIGPASFRSFYLAEAALHKAFAEAAWGKVAS